MGYLHILNLYSPKAQQILEFKNLYCLEKIDGSSSHVSWTPAQTSDGQNSLRFFSGGEKHEMFLKIFDQEELLAKLNAKFAGYTDTVTIFGEVYGGKCQGMSATYGKDLKFVAFDVKVGNSWLSVLQADECVTSLGLEFVDYKLVETTCNHTNGVEAQEFLGRSGEIRHVSNRLCLIDAERDRPSEQAKRNGITEDKKREGVVLRPPFEVTLNNGERLIAKHKNADLRETKTIREVDPNQKIILESAQAKADEYVVGERLQHVISRLVSSRDKKEVGIEDTGSIIKLMIEDILRESEGEVEDTPANRKAISQRTALMFKKQVTQI